MFGFGYYYVWKALLHFSSFFCNSNTPTSSCTRASMSIRKRRRLSRHNICYWIGKYLSALEFSISSQTRSHSWKLSLQVSETSPLFSVPEKYFIFLQLCCKVLQLHQQSSLAGFHLFNFFAHFFLFTSLFLDTSVSSSDFQALLDWLFPSSIHPFTVFLVRWSNVE